MKYTLILIITLVLGQRLAAQTITLDSVSGTLFCTEDSITVYYHTVGPFDAGNRFVLQMSDTHGSFSSFTNLATDLRKSGQFVQQLDTVGDHYRFRVMSTSPLVTSADNGEDVRILAYPRPLAQVWRPTENRIEYVGLVGVPLRFISQRVGVDSANWSFSSDALPAQTTNPNPSVVYGIAGIKTGVLSVTNAAGCQSLASTSVVIGECHPMIPKGTRVVTGVETGLLTDSSVLVKTGATFTAAGRGPFFVEPGAVIVIGERQYHSLTYLMNGSAVQLDPSGQAAYFVLGNQVVWTNMSDLFDTVRCDDLSFDYSQLTSSVASGVAATSALQPLADGAVAWSGEDAVAVQVLSLLGQTLRTVTMDRNHMLSLTAFPHGVYILRPLKEGIRSLRVVR